MLGEGQGALRRSRQLMELGRGERRLLKVGGDVLPALNSMLTVAGPGTILLMSTVSAH